MHIRSLSASTAALSPTRETDRLLALDILRAIALLGIFVVNMEFFTRPLEASAHRIDEAMTGLDALVAWCEHVFARGKFWTMFSLLFGMGFAVMAQRARAAGRRFVPVYARRIAFLGVLGVAHAVLVWGGDVLHTYAMGAVVLLALLHGRWWYLLGALALFVLLIALHGPTKPFVTGAFVCMLFAGAAHVLRVGDRVTAGMPRLSIVLAISALVCGVAFWRAPSFPAAAGLVSFGLFAVLARVLRGTPLQRLWRTGLTLYAILPVAVLSVSLLMQAVGPAIDGGAGATAVAEHQARVAEAAQVHAYGDYAANVMHRLQAMQDGLGNAAIFGLCTIVGMFLLGVWCVRSGVMTWSVAHRGLFRGWAAILLPLGLAGTVFATWLGTGKAYPSSGATIASQVMQLANLAMCFGYVGLAMLFIDRGTSPRLAWLAPAGRMALTNYLTQSVVCTWLFYGHGGALWGRVDRLGQLGLVLGVFALQVLASHWWMARFRFGPMEWLWRSVTYGAWQPVRREREPVSGQRIAPRVLGGCVLALGAAVAGLARADDAAKISTAPALIDRAVFFADAERDQARISPDGRFLAWLARAGGAMNVWVAPIDDLPAARPVTQDRGRGIGAFEWTFKPGTLVYERDTGGDGVTHLFAVDVATGAARDLAPTPEARAILLHASARRPGVVEVGIYDRDPRWADAYVVDLGTATRTLLYRNEDRIESFHFDDALHLRSAQRTSADGVQELLWRHRSRWTRVEAVPSEDALTTRILAVRGDGRIRYDADSRQRDTAALVSVDVHTGKRTLLHADPRADIAEVLRHPRTGAVQAVSVDALQETWVALDTAVAPDLRRLAALGEGRLRITSRTLDDRTWIVVHDAPDAPRVTYRYDRATQSPVRLFSSHPALEGRPLARMWPTTIPARDGLSLPAYVTLPAQADPDHDGHADRTVPMVLLVHGGPVERDRFGYDATVQWLASRGYAVLQVNYRGSLGFGKQFINAADGEWAGKMHDDLLDAVDWAIAQGIARRDGVAIMGRSYGGYATLVGLSFTPERFRCGVDIVGPADLVALGQAIPPHWTQVAAEFARRVGDPSTGAGRAQLIARSPLTHADRISRPLLVVQGANDPQVPRAQSDRMVAALDARGVPVTYALFPDEGHGFARAENRTALNAIAEGFLGQCLGGVVQSIGDDFGGASLVVPPGAAYVPGLQDALRSHVPDVRD
jgi:dipeptidyl aminopeptidase/acylaminoacyl peptidase/uncharacterized membrane protein YeiB